MTDCQTHLLCEHKYIHSFKNYALNKTTFTSETQLFISNIRNTVKMTYNVRRRKASYIEFVSHMSKLLQNFSNHSITHIFPHTDSTLNSFRWVIKLVTLLPLSHMPQAPVSYVTVSPTTISRTSLLHLNIHWLHWSSLITQLPSFSYFLTDFHLHWNSY